MRHVNNSILFFILILIVSCSNPGTKSHSLTDGERYVTLNGVEHWIQIKGATNKGTPIVIVHGGPGGNNYNFERTIGPLLEEIAPIVYYEQRGCGRSRAPKDTTDYTISTLISDLDRLREEFGLDQMTLLGYSFGAELSLRYAIAHPNRIKQLILSSPAELSNSNFLIQIHGFYSLAGNELRKEIEEILREDISLKNKYLSVWDRVSTPVVDSFLFENQDVAKMNRRLWVESKLTSEGSGYFRKVIFENSKGDIITAVEGLKTHCLIISGIHDKNGGLHTGILLHKTLVNSEFKLYENSAHFPDMEESERYVKDIREFVLSDLNH